MSATIQREYLVQSVALVHRDNLGYLYCPDCTEGEITEASADEYVETCDGCGCCIGEKTRSLPFSALVEYPGCKIF